MSRLLGFDIGGTKCAVVLGADPAESGGRPDILARRQIPTQGTPEQVVAALVAEAKAMTREIPAVSAGISCGGPLDSVSGRILSPPNLVGWDDIPVTGMVSGALGIPCALQNDANACALAEWRFGAGRGLRNMVFLTCGTGFGAGLILNGALYGGTNDMAGEIGHIRAAEDGPVGYGKRGSFEGFCSGSGIAQIARSLALERMQRGTPAGYCPSPDKLGEITAKSVAEAADAGDETACEVYKISGKMLGRASAVLIDLLNPEAIVIGSIFARSGHLLRDACEEVVRAECLPYSSRVCKILPAALGDSIGDYAALAVAVGCIPERSKNT